jgi:mannose-6-phosphate isomerase-like protein (cupin superfamily)
MHLSADRARQALTDAGARFIELFRHGSLAVELYQPVGEDRQQPHSRDEVYVVLSGHGQFECQGETVAFQAGDFLFVPAYAPHRFVHFSDDFATWVFFYGPEGGEAPRQA